MNEVLKPVPSIENLFINHDGTLVYYNDKLKRINLRKGANGLHYKYVNIKNKSYAISKLVYEAFIYSIPERRNIVYINNDHTDTHYLNLGPKPCLLAALVHMKKVPGYDELYINNNGTVISQYGYEISIRIQRDHKKPRHCYFAACINTGKGVAYSYVSILVAKAWLGWNGRGKIVHKDFNTRNNHYKNLQPYTLKQYGKRNIEILERARKKRTAYHSAIPKTDIELVKERLLQGDTLAKIAADYHCTDMSIVRFKKRHFTAEQIKQMNLANGINTEHTPTHIVQAIVNDLKKGSRQIDVATKYQVSTTVVCRINKSYIKRKLHQK